jgi:hypothetical protein
MKLFLAGSSVVATLGPDLILSKRPCRVCPTFGRLFGKFEQVRGKTARFTVSRLPLILGVRDNVQDAADSGDCFRVVLTTDARLRWSDLLAESREAIHEGLSLSCSNK